MATDNDVVEIKIHRDKIGTIFPYDKLYFFPKNKRDLIPQIFRFALVLPVGKELLQNITHALVPKKISYLRHTRGNSVYNEETGFDGRNKHASSDITAWWRDLYSTYSLKDRVAVVPILVSASRSKLIPSYITSRKWYTRQGERPRIPVHRFNTSSAAANTQKKKFKPAVHELAYIATPSPPPNDKISPPCSICPRGLQHLNGECQLGELICYKSLDFKNFATQGEEQ